MKINEAIEWGKTELDKNKNDNSFFETRRLLESSTSRSKEWLMMNYDYELTDEEYSKFISFIERRLKSEPLQHILGYQDFMYGKFIVNENVLIPRSDTEVLVEKALEKLQNIASPQIIDICTGSGCIAISLKMAKPSSKVYASDISEKALNIAIENAKLNNVEVKFIKSDLLDDVEETMFDVIVSNPPYIRSDEIEKLQEEVKKEPIIALDGGKDGLNFYRRIAHNAKSYIKSNGYILFEIGYDQREAVSNILKNENFYDIECFNDFSGNPRVVVAKNI